MAYTDDRRSIVNLITDVIADMTALFQTEIRLARAEIDEKVNRIASSGTLIGAGVVAALAALFLLLQAIVSWLVIAGLPQQWAYLIVGICVAALAAGLLMKGINNLKSTRLVPDRTIDQLKADYLTVKEHVK